jgi:hypothetical protein
MTMPETLSVDAFADAGLRLDAFDMEDAGEWMMDDLWFLNAPLVDLNQ